MPDDGQVTEIRAELLVMVRELKNLMLLAPESEMTMFRKHGASVKARPGSTWNDLMMACVRIRARPLLHPTIG